MEPIAHLFFFISILLFWIPFDLLLDMDHGDASGSNAERTTVTIDLSRSFLIVRLRLIKMYGNTVILFMML
jgi:hypothetical protein